MFKIYGPAGADNPVFMRALDGAAGGAGAGDAGGSDGGAAGGGDAAGGQQSNGAWYGEIADEGLRGWAENKGFADPISALTSYRNLEKLFGADKAGNTVAKPNWEDQTAVDQFYDALGRPKEPTGYELKLPDQHNADLVDWARSAFHKSGLTQKQAEALMGQYLEREQSTAQQRSERYQAEVADADKALRQEWGQGYNERVAAAKKAASEFGIDDAGLDKLEAALGYADTIKFLSNIGSRLGEHGRDDGGQTSDKGFNTMTPAQAKSQLDALMRDKDFLEAWRTKNHPGHAGAVARKSELMRLAHPD